MAYTISNFIALTISNFIIMKFEMISFLYGLFITHAILIFALFLGYLYIINKLNNKKNII